MRTTITIAPDVQVEVERLRREKGMDPSEALNTLARKGIAAMNRLEPRYVQHSAALGQRVDVRDVAELLDLLDDEEPADILGGAESC